MLTITSGSARRALGVTSARVRRRHRIEAVASLARHKSLNIAQKYARKTERLKRAPSKNPALADLIATARPSNPTTL